MSMNRIYHLSDLHSIENEWNSIYNANSFKSIFNSIEFIRLWYKCFAAPEHIRIYKAAYRETTIGFLPLVAKSKMVRILSSLTNDHCMHSGPLIAEGFEDLFPGIILEELFKNRHSWDLLLYRYSYPFSKCPVLFPDDLLKGRAVPYRWNNEPTYSVPLDKPFEAYFKRDLSSKVRGNLNRWQRLLEKSGEWSLKRFDNDEAIDLWPEFMRLENCGWKGDEGTSIAILDKNHLTFYQDFLRLLADAGVLKLYFLELNGQFIAAGIGYMEGDTFHYLKTGYDAKFHKLSPSNLLLLHVSKDLQLNSMGTKRVHMFPRDDDYKHRFAKEEAVCSHLLLFSDNVLATAAYYLYLARKIPIVRSARGRLNLWRHP